MTRASQWIISLLVYALTAQVIFLPKHGQTDKLTDSQTDRLTKSAMQLKTLLNLVADLPTRVEMVKVIYPHTHSTQRYPSARIQGLFNNIFTCVMCFQKPCGISLT